MGIRSDRRVAVMAMAAVWIAPMTGAPNLTSAEVCEALWRHIGLRDRVEHLRIRAGPSRYLVFGFVMADSDEQAQVTVERLTDRAIAVESALAHWRRV